jgi:hypothetical protein
VGKSSDNEIGILCYFGIGEIFTKIIYDSPEFGIDIRIRLACKSLACKMAESEVRVVCKTSYEFCTYISC